ncbi:hypothetical protein L484_015084 [Morus notabilis]|uniref:Uncharacterized protein n=1 Tax=Morus notabilis TaxID=981085 RepID=W9SVU3_9ROSA|nr:hypothetical protein L484_015084 [Morus notabilis]
MSSDCASTKTTRSRPFSHGYPPPTSVDDGGDKERLVGLVSGKVVVRAKSSSLSVRIFQPFWHQRFKSFGNDFPIVWSPPRILGRLRCVCEGSTGLR